MLKFQEGTFKRPGVRTALFQGIFHRPDDLRRELLWEQLQSGPGRPGFVEALTNLLGYDILDKLGDVEVPTLIVWGRQDRVVPSSDAAEWGRRLANSRTVILDETGHVPQLERPVRFNRLLEALSGRSPERLTTPRLALARDRADGRRARRCRRTCAITPDS